MNGLKNLKTLNAYKIVFIILIGCVVTVQPADAFWNPFKKLTERAKQIIKLIKHGLKGGVVDWGRLHLNLTAVSDKAKGMQDSLNYYRNAINELKTEVVNTADMIKSMSSDLDYKKFIAGFKNINSSRNELSKIQEAYLKDGNYILADSGEVYKKTKQKLAPFIAHCKEHKTIQNVCEAATISSLINMDNKTKYVKSLKEIDKRLSELSRHQTNTAVEAKNVTNEILLLKSQIKIIINDYKLNQQLIEQHMSTYLHRMEQLGFVENK